MVVTTQKIQSKSNLLRPSTGSMEIFESLSPSIVNFCKIDPKNTNVSIRANGSPGHTRLPEIKAELENSIVPKFVAKRGKISQLISELTDRKDHHI